MNRGRAAFGLTVLACGWLAFLVVAALVVPVYSGETSAGGREFATPSSTLVGENGSWVLVGMAIPVLLGLITWFGLHRKCSRVTESDEMLVWLPIGILFAFSILTGFSVGMAIFPAALVLTFAAAITPRATA